MILEAIVMEMKKVPLKVSKKDTNWVPMTAKWLDWLLVLLVEN